VYVLDGPTLARDGMLRHQQAIHASEQAEKHSESVPRRYRLATAVRPATAPATVTHVQPAVSRLMRRTHAALVAQTPHHHARAVLVPLVHSRNAPQVGRPPFGLVGEIPHCLPEYLGVSVGEGGEGRRGSGGKSHSHTKTYKRRHRRTRQRQTWTYLEAMCLYIGLVDEEKPNFVADLVPAWVVRIVGAAHGVEVQRLHYTRVTVHAGETDASELVRGSRVYGGGWSW